jgi:outer membrane lipoprotein-sorting protein
MSLHGRRAAAALVGLFVASAAAHAATAADPAPSLATRAARFPKVTTATADFVQERHVSLVDDVLRARGTLTLAAPASFRLDLREPEPMTLVASGASVTVVDANGTATAIPAEYTGLASFAHTLTDLLLGTHAPHGFHEAWHGPDTVVLTPDADTTSPFDEITLTFPPDGPLPSTIAMREHGGDRTTIQLERVALNPVLDPARFASAGSQGVKHP